MMRILKLIHIYVLDCTGWFNFLFQSPDMFTNKIISKSDRFHKDIIIYV